MAGLVAGETQFISVLGALKAVGEGGASNEIEASVDLVAAFALLTAQLTQEIVDTDAAVPDATVKVTVKINGDRVEGLRMVGADLLESLEGAGQKITPAARMALG